LQLQDNARETSGIRVCRDGAHLGKRIREIRLVFDDVVYGICETALETKADAIVMRVRGNVRWDRAATHLPWALAHRVIAKATCPV
jgi:nucleotide-binding universal stress UspA family protein